MAQKRREKAADFTQIVPQIDVKDFEDTLVLGLLKELPVKKVLAFAKRSPGRMESTMLILNATRLFDRGSKDKTFDSLVGVLDKASQKGDLEFDLVLTALMTSAARSPTRFREMVRKFG
jgi:hypothetical protein